MLAAEIEGNALFVLDSGEMGMGVGTFKEDDQLVTVPGVTRHLILRRTNDYWVLVGHPWVDNRQASGIESEEKLSRIEIK
jgi:hypothetical protein